MAELLSDIALFLSRLDWLSLFDILLVTAVIFWLLTLVRGTQAAVILRGIIFLILTIAVLTSFLRLRAFSWLLRTTLPALLISIPVIFAPEIRRALERLGRAGTALNLGLREGLTDVQTVIDAIATAAQRLSERRHGGLIVIERQVGLKDYAETGVALDAAMTVELVLQIFYPNTPLHDGAAILKGGRIVAAACIMPLTSSETITDRQMGLRHRAALGISEVSDAVAVIVSEETGMISVAHNGRMIRRLDAARLRNILAAFYRPRGRRTWLAWLRSWLTRRSAETPRGKGKEAAGD
jgi:diadenylate cyclase